MSFADLVDLDRWVERAQSDPELGVIGRWSEFELRLSADDEPAQTTRFAGGELNSVSDSYGEDDGRDRVVLHGSVQAWRDFLSTPPPPDSHHVLAMDRRRTDFEIAEGRHELVRHLRVINRLLELLRDSTHPDSAGK